MCSLLLLLYQAHALPANTLADTLNQHSPTKIHVTNKYVCININGSSLHTCTPSGCSCHIKICMCIFTSVVPSVERASLTKLNNRIVVIVKCKN